MPSLQDVISRMGEASLGRIIDYRVLELLTSVNGKYGSFSRHERAEIIIEYIQTENIISTKQIRNEVIIALSKEEIDNLSNLLELPEDALYNFRNSANRIDKLRDFFSIPTPESIDEIEENIWCPICDGTGQHDSDIPYYSLYEYQRIALYKCKSIIENKDLGSRVMLHMPTGSGKTRTAMHLVCRELLIAEPTVVLWLANGKELCDQAADEFRSAWTRMGDREVGTSRFYGSKSNWESIGDGFIVAGLQKIWNFFTADPHRVGPLAESINMIVFDEAHQSVAKTYKIMTELLLKFNPNIKLIGLSATPGRAHYEGDERADMSLVDLFQHNKVRLEHPDYDSAIGYLISNGFLSEISYHDIEYLTEELSPQQSKRISDSFTIPEDILTELGLDVQRNLALIDEVTSISESHRRVLLFAPSVASSNLLAAVLRLQGFDAVSITSNTKKNVRQDHISRFKNNKKKCMILCNYGVLTTGFDAPSITAIIIARPTKSIVLYSQMVGRGIRGGKMGGTDRADIYTVQDTSIPVFVNIVQQFKNWEESWGEIND